MKQLFQLTMVPFLRWRAMAELYSRSLLRVAVAQIAQQLGWTSIQSTPLELLTDILERYVLETAKYTHRYSEQCEWFIN